MQYSIAVQTRIARANGEEIFSDTMQWRGVDETVLGWFTASCKTAAFGLSDAPKAADPSKSYTIKYRTKVYNGLLCTGRKKSDTTPIEFEHLTYADMIRFQHWAVGQLDELIDLFEQRHRAKIEDEPTTPRNKIMAMIDIGWQVLRNKTVGRNAR